MSDRYLRQLLRAAQAGDIPLTDYVAAALRVMSLEDIRLDVKTVWIPAYAAQSKENKNRVALAGALGDAVSKRVVPSRRRDDFQKPSFFKRNRKLLSDSEWRLFSADCAERVLHIWEANVPNDNSPRLYIETTRRFAAGLASIAELTALQSETRSASCLTSWSIIALSAVSAAKTASTIGPVWSRSWSASSSATLAASNAVGGLVNSSTLFKADTAEKQGEISWQRSRLIDYLTGLSALPPSES